MTREQAAAALQAIAQTPDGATVLNYLVGRFGYARRSTFSPEPATMAFQEGQRSVLVDIGGLLDLDTTPKPEEDHDRRPDIDFSRVGDGAPDLDGARWGDDDPASWDAAGSD